MPVYIPAAEQKSGVWRGGQIHEIYRDPPSADFPTGDFRLWVGTATIERSADYSYFANAERLHILVAGDGLRLHFREPDATVDLATQQAHTFSGTRPLHAEVSGAPVVAFNLIYRQGLTSGADFVALDRRPHLQTIHTDAERDRTQIVHVVSGSVALESTEGAWLMDAGDTLVWNLDGPSTQQLHVQSQIAEALLLFAHVSGPNAQPTTSA